MDDSKNIEQTQESPTEGFEKLRAVRIEKLGRIREAGVRPYPYRFEVTHKVAGVAGSEKALTEDETIVALAGRVMALRGHGKTSFGHLEDSTGRIQFYVRRDADAHL